MSKRLKPEVRKEQVIEAALSLAAKSHYLEVGREEIASALGFSASTIRYHFKTLTQLRKEVVRAAVKQEHLAVIAQAVTANHPQAVKVSKALRRRALMASV